MRKLTTAIKTALCIACQDRIGDLQNHCEFHADSIHPERMQFWQNKIAETKAALAWIEDQIPTK